MPESKVASAVSAAQINGHRTILVADDEPVNRELLGFVLSSAGYSVLFAANGREALDILKARRTDLSLVLLDLMMPEMSGQELLQAVHRDRELKAIPIIVLTSDQNAEIECLQLGAIDFIPKPYPSEGVILARVKRTIELYEDRQLISATERDPLTNLFNREYFYRYAEQFDQFNPDVATDAVYVDISHFHLINERFGRAYGDELLRSVSAALKDALAGTGSIIGRLEADTFMLYCPDSVNYDALINDVTSRLENVRLRVGVYPRADKALDIEHRFDRAKNALGTVRGGFSRSAAFYDDELHKTDLYNEQLIDDFPRALKNGDFTVYYQPKFDIRPDTPVLASAEALVRWKHPQLGMISPGVFIPLFEKNGLINALDEYVWRSTARQISLWKQKYGKSIPVSVNVSRIDMLDPLLSEKLRSAAADHGLTPQDLLLEITESAYTGESDQIINTVNALREMGFKIEMDDFGTGYSSLSMISALPIDALKLDMRFIRDAFAGGSDTRLIEIIIDIADYLGVPVIAEGVETAQQLAALRSMGCDIVQGYYFSKPVPAQEFDAFILNMPDAPALSVFNPKPDREHRLASFNAKSALAESFDEIFYIDSQSGKYISFAASNGLMRLTSERGGADFFADVHERIAAYVDGADRERVSNALSKDALLRTLSKQGRLGLTFCMIKNGASVYYSLYAAEATPGYLVIGISDVDQQLKQIYRYRDLNSVNRDALTGVKSRHLYKETAVETDAEIAEGKGEPFALAMCDVNDLKLVNDTQGHAAGDALIKNAAMIICEIFQHSPVFRYGGDEFVVLLRRGDFDNRRALMDKLTSHSRDAVSNGGIVIAAGLAEYDPATDKTTEDVFRRADALMYENKKLLKRMLGEL